MRRACNAQKINVEHSEVGLLHSSVDIPASSTSNYWRLTSSLDFLAARGCTLDDPDQYVAG